MERERNPPSVRMNIVSVAPFLPLKSEAISLKSGSKLASAERSETGEIDAHTVTATTVRSETLTLGGRDAPVSNSSSITSWTTS
jgi:hypothetical protein